MTQLEVAALCTLSVDTEDPCAALIDNVLDGRGLAWWLCPEQHPVGAAGTRDLYVECIRARVHERHARHEGRPSHEMANRESGDPNGDGGRDPACPSRERRRLASDAFSQRARHRV